MLSFAYDANNFVVVEHTINLITETHKKEYNLYLNNFYRYNKLR